MATLWVNYYPIVSSGCKNADVYFLGRAFPSFEMCSPYVTATSVNDLLPVTLCSGTGVNVVVPANQKDLESANMAIRTAVFKVG